MANKKKEAITAKKVSDLLIIDVLKMPLFFKNVSIELKNIWKSREKARKLLKPNERLKAHPIDDLYNADLLNPTKFIVEFEKILDKNNVNLSSSEREVLRTLGMTAFNNTVQKLIDDEKKGNFRNGDNK